MQVYQSKQLISNLQKQTEEILAKAISEYQMMGSVKMLKQPEENKWSAAQCLEHLNSYRRYYLPQIERAIKTAKTHNSLPDEQFTPGWLGNYFTNLMLPKEGKQMKMKAPKEHQPIADLDSDKVISEFIDQQEKLVELLEQAREINLNKARVPISIAKFIKLKLGDVFGFLIAHNQRHILQAERALEAAALKGEERKEVVA
jgi:hypothetical protein